MATNHNGKGIDQISLVATGVDCFIAAEDASQARQCSIATFDQSSSKSIGTSVCNAPLLLEGHADSNATEVEVSTNVWSAQGVVDWSSLIVTNVPDEDDSGVLMTDAEMCNLLGITIDSDNVREQVTPNAPMARKVVQSNTQEDDTIGAAIPVDDFIPEENRPMYDKDHPTMNLGDMFPSMDEFRMAVRQYAINNEFDMDIVRSEPKRFVGKCKGEGCTWRINARRMLDEKTIRVTKVIDGHMCSSSSRIKSSMASRSWVADKAITILKNTPNVGAKQLQKQLQDDYKVTIGYDTVWQGREIAVNNLYGNWEESFQRLYNFKAEVELRSPGSIVEIDTINVRGNVHFNRFFCAFRPCIEGFVVGCRPYISIDSTALNGKWNGQLCAVTALDGSEQDRHVVKTHIHECTCLEWQHTGKPCPHALAFLTTQKNVNMEDYVHEYYSLQKFRAAYEGAIEPMTGKAQWPRVELGFTVLPPIAKRSAGRRRKQRIKNCFEKGVKVKRLQNKNKCKRCGELGHRQAGCPLNGTKKRKRKSRTDTRSEASSRGKGKETPSTPIKSTINIPSSLSGSPGPITRRQLALAMADGPSQVVLPTSPQRARTSPAKAKKITPKKKKN